MKNIKIKFNNLTLYFLLISFLSGYIKNSIIILIIVLFHEFGHIITGLILGFKIKSVEIFLFGGITKFERLLNSSIKDDLLIALSGVCVQIIIQFLCLKNIIIEPLVCKYNLSIMLFNLLPIIPLDGSKILFELLNYKLSYRLSLIFYIVVSFFFIVLYFLLNYQYELNNYMIIILFVYKTIDCLKNRRVIHHKFILERFLYDIDFTKVKNSNQKVSNYYKDTKYYYNIDNKIIGEKEYLNKYYFH